MLFLENDRMKKLITVCILILSVQLGYSQGKSISQIDKLSPKVKSTSIQHVPTKKVGVNKSNKSVTVIWTEDFSIPTFWSYLGGTNDWDVVDTMSSSLISIGFDSTINSVSGGKFALIDSDGAGAGQSQDSYIEYGGIIDCSGFLGVRLQFTTYLRQFSEVREVLISNDGGANWDTYPVLTQFGINTNSPNGYVETVNISASAGGQANVKIKFHYMGGNDWFWAVDDVMMTSIPNNEMTYSGPYFHSASLDSNATKYYQMIPQFQALADVVTASTTISNTGLVNQTNVSLNWEWTTPKSSTSVSSMPTTIASDTTDSVFVNNTMPLGTDSLGVYNWKFFVSSDSINDVEDTTLIDVEVTDTTYARTTQFTGNQSFSGFSYEIGTMFEMFDTAKVTSLNVGFGSDTRAGNIFSIRIYDTNFTQVTSKEFIEIDSNSLGTLASYAIKETLLNPGMYIVAIKVFADSTYFMSSPVVADPLTVFVDPDGSGSWYWATTSPAIQLNISSDLSTCDVIANATQTGNNEATVTVTGGIVPYTYVWNTGDSTEVVNGLNPDSTYTVYVIDGDSCVSNVATVDIISGILGLDVTNEVSVYPNPNDGSFSLNIGALNDVRKVSIYDLTGKLIEVRSFSGVRVSSQTFSINVPGGVYLLVLETESKKRYQSRIVVR